MRLSTSLRGAKATKQSGLMMDRFALLAMTAVACLFLSSCLTPTGTQKPVGVVTYGAKSGAGSTGIHSVLPGDTVYTVSQRYNLPLRDIITLNHLSAPYKLAMGYRLKLPAPNEYKVQQGDTLNGVSRIFNTSVSEMARLNNLPEPFVLRSGQILRLPSPQPKLEEEFAASAVPSALSSEVTAVGPLRVPSVESEVLAAPAYEGAASQTVSPVTTSASVTASSTGFPPQPSAKPAGAVVVPNVPAQAAQVQTASVVTPSIAPKIPARASGKFMRPVDGKIISGYGPKDDGLHNDGINIKAPKGTAVRAAENGVVAYTGSGMSGYGNLVLIRHADRYMTAYAHMDKMLVKKGDTVKVGQTIGTVGSTGGVDSSQLHFEVRKGTQAIDPAKFI